MLTGCPPVPTDFTRPSWQRRYKITGHLSVLSAGSVSEMARCSGRKQSRVVELLTLKSGFNTRLFCRHESFWCGRVHCEIRSFCSDCHQTAAHSLIHVRTDGRPIVLTLLARTWTINPPPRNNPKPDGLPYLSIYLFTYLSVYLFIYLSIHLSIYPFVHLSIHPSIYGSIALSVYPSIFLYVYLYLYLFLYLYIYIYAHIFVCMYVRKACMHV